MALCLVPAGLCAQLPEGHPERDTGFDNIISQYSAPDREALRDSIVFLHDREVFSIADVALYLSDFDRRNFNVASDYAREVDAWFRPHRDHPLIQRLDELVVDGRSYNNFRNNSVPFGFDGEYFFLIGSRWFSHLDGRIPNSFVRHATLFEDFTVLSRAREFRREHEADYREAADAFGSRIRGREIWAWLEERFPDYDLDVVFVTVSLLSNGIHSAVWWNDDEWDVIHIFLDSPGGHLDFPAHSADRAFFTEIDHRFANPTSWDYRDRIETPTGFAEGFWVDRAGINAAYPSGYSVFNEYLTWALYELWARDAYDERTVAAARAEVERIMVEYRGFPHYPAFVDALFRLHDEAAARSGGPTVPIAALYTGLLDWAENYRATR